MADLPKTFWPEVAEGLHTLLTAVTARAQYPAGHRALEGIDAAAAAGMGRLLTTVPELMVAIVEGEFVIAERPLPDLRERLPGLLDALERHGLECLVFLEGFDAADVAALCTGLAAAPDVDRPDAARERMQLGMRHVLVRWIALQQRELEAAEELGEPPLFEGMVSELLATLSYVMQLGVSLDQEGVREVAKTICMGADARYFALPPRLAVRGEDDLAAHTANVAIMAAAMAKEADFPAGICVEITCAALVHDAGHLLLPEELRGVPEPLLNDRQRAMAQEHPFLGARALFDRGCPPMWVAAALDHHRGVDGLGYPARLSALPHAVTRIVSVANYLDRKRARLVDGPADPMESAVSNLRGLSGRYFEPTWADAAIRAIGIYPPGTTVELSDGRQAVVLRATPREPLRPVVRLVSPPEGETGIVDLAGFQVLERRFGLAINRALFPDPDDEPA